MRPFLKKNYKVIHTLFFKYGVNCVSMDDIAYNTCTSKKTIYREYKCKDELVKDLFVSDYIYFEYDVKSLGTINIDAINKTVKLFDAVHKKINAFTATVLFDLKKYYPDLFRDLLVSYKKLIFGSFASIIQFGKTENLFTQMINPDSIANLITSLFESHVYYYLSANIADNIFSRGDVLDYHFRSICTSFGLQRWELYKHRSFT